MVKSYEQRNHQEWLGYVQPIGLVVSAPAMLAAECQINRNMGPIHQRFMSTLPLDESEEPIPLIPDFATFAQNVLGWRADDLIEFPLDNVPKELQGLEVVLDAYNETLRPTHVVPEFKPAEDQSPWVMLIQEHAAEIDLDTISEETGRHWAASPHLKFERLLRESEVPFGILTNGKAIRMVYAPKGETSGYITFQVDQMATVAGRPIFAALHMLLEEERVFSMEPARRLPAILANSRKYQNIVSTKLAEQVMSSLFELLRGFQAADDQRGGVLLKEILANDPQHIYHGLLNVLMRMVFVLYAEDRGLISTDEVYTNHYSISGLFERLRSDAGRFPDTMDQRYGAWAQLLTLFHLIHDGGSHGDLQIPARDGYLFDPNRYPFLDGRYDNYNVEIYSQEERESAVQVPRVSDGTIYRVLEDLLVLDGERLSYRTLDVEQIGSVYEAIMGFELHVAEGRSIAIKPAKKHGAPATINLEALLDAKPANRVKLLKEWSDQSLTGESLKELKSAESIDALMNALAKKIDSRVTPNIVPKGAMVFQPSDERRRSGSHYTPRSLTEPIVETTLEPVMKQLVGGNADDETNNRREQLVADSSDAPAPLLAAESSTDYITNTDSLNFPSVWQPTPADKKRYTKGEIELRIKASQRKLKHAQAARNVGTPHPSQILDLKICDPAMGSGAFLVETCRQLADILVDAWYAHDAVPTDIPPDEDEVLYARRLIAQRCLYGVDKNVMAVDLAKLSLWLVTLAKDHAFTFLDHALRHGDSLVGLTREQIIGFHWEVKKQKKFGEDLIQRRLDRATEARAKILNAREDVPYRDQAARMANADEALDLIRLVGDACVSGFFAGQKKKEREEHAERLFGVASSYLESLTAGRGKQVDFESRRVLGQAAARLRAGSHPIPAFHWEIEFPEVFARENGGFDAFVGNPPFLGGNKISGSFGAEYLAWLSESHPNTDGNSDFVAYFFRVAFNLMRKSGASGLIATNTIGQGDTRRAGLTYIISSGGAIYFAKKRFYWPGVAAVVVSVVHFVKNKRAAPTTLILDDNVVPAISSYLLPNDRNNDPVGLSANDGICFRGVTIVGDGFILEPNEALSLIQNDERNAQIVRAYVGGREINSNPKMTFERYVINFGTLPLEDARTWPALIAIVEERVKPERDKKTSNAIALRQKKYWWRFRSDTPLLREAVSQLSQCLAACRVGSHISFSFQEPNQVFADSTNCFALEDWQSFGVLQSRIHEVWARFLGSSMKDDLRYNPSDCFETFPFPHHHHESSALGNTAREYYEFRSRNMLAADEGLTTTYNRFHDPHEQSEGILELRRLHGLMDGAVLRAYGWDDLAESARCEFLLDYEEEEDDADAGPPAAGARKKSKKKKPWRLRWPDEFRDEVLARLLELNEQRHKQEQLVGKAEATTKKKSKKESSKRSKKRNSGSTAELF